MLRYFYLFSMLFSIQLTFCYEYTEQEYNRQVRRHNLKQKKNAKLNLRHDNFYDPDKRHLNKRHDYEALGDKEDNEPVAQFDVASFIQNPEDDAIDDNASDNYRNKKQKRISKDYYDYELGNYTNMGEKEVKLNKMKDYTFDSGDADNLYINSALLQTLINSKHIDLNNFPVDGLPGQEHKNKAVKTREIQKDVAQNPDKKCSLRHMKFPFFSHNKTATPKYKTQKKRKLFHLRRSKNGGQSEASSTLEPDISPDVDKRHTDAAPNRPFKIIKRSYEELLCPRCRRKYFARNNSKIESKRIEHSEREIDQNANIDEKEDSMNSNKFINDHQSSKRNYLNDMYVSQSKTTKNGKRKRDENKEKELEDDRAYKKG